MTKLDMSSVESSQSVLGVKAYNNSGDSAAWIFQKLGTPSEDGRVEEWLFMSSPWPTLSLALLYLLICYFGPRLMENRKPWDLKAFIVTYNFCLVLLSAYMFIELVLVSLINPSFDNLCSPVDYSSDPKSVRLLAVLWLYYFSKFIEFTETFVFILRKKTSQISFLHVYHHSSMFILWWLTVKHCGGGSAYFPAMMNCMIHTVMYTYYLLAALGDSVRPYLWWKKYLTRFQLIQFWIVTFHTLYSIYQKCGYPRGYQSLLVIYMFTQKALFMNFYKKAYKPSQTAKPSELDQNDNLSLNGKHQNGKAD